MGARVSEVLFIVSAVLFIVGKFFLALGVLLLALGVVVLDVFVTTWGKGGGKDGEEKIIEPLE